MPFKSKAQQRFLFANFPAIAAEFAKHMPQKAYGRLPWRKKKDVVSSDAHPEESCCGRVYVTDAAPPPDDLNPTTLQGFLALEAFLLLWMQRKNQPIKAELLREMKRHINSFDPADGNSIANLLNDIDQALAEAGKRSGEVLNPVLIKGQSDIGKRVRQFAISKWGSQIVPWDSTDDEKTAWMGRNAHLFTEAYFKDTLSARARKILQDAYALYGDELAKFKKVAKDKIEPVVAATDSYWSANVTNALNLARSYQSILAMQQTAGVKGYQIKAVIDSRTTRLCLSLDQRTFLISEALPIFDLIASATTHDEIEAIKPMLRSTKEGDIYAANIPISRDLPSSDLLRLGIIFPPFHWMCRSTLVPIFG